MMENRNCYNCTHFSPLATPQPYDEITSIHGYCFKDLADGHDGYPVYIPNGYCKKHIKKSNEEVSDG